MMSTWLVRVFLSVALNMMLCGGVQAETWKFNANVSAIPLSKCGYFTVFYNIWCTGSVMAYVTVQSVRQGCVEVETLS